MLERLVTLLLPFTDNFKYQSFRIREAGVDGAFDAVTVFFVTMQTLASINNAAPCGNELEPVAGE